MAKLLRAFCLLATLALSAAAPSPSPTAGSCTEVVYGLADCLPYVTNGTNVTEPDKLCCEGLASIIEKSPECACTILETLPKLGLDLNMTRAVGLPAACSVELPSTGGCEDASPPGAPAPSPPTPSPAPSPAPTPSPMPSPAPTPCPTPSPVTPPPPESLPVIPPPPKSSQTLPAPKSSPAPPTHVFPSPEPSTAMPPVGSPEALSPEAGISGARGRLSVSFRALLIVLAAAAFL